MRKLLPLLIFSAIWFTSYAQTPIAHWQFENNTRDSIGEAHGYVQPEGYEVSYSDTDVKQGDYSIDFDGGFHINCLDPDTLKDLDEFTVAFWMKLDEATAGNQQSIIEKDGKFRVILLDGGYLDLVVATEDIGWYQTGGSLQKFPVPPSGEWVHVALYYDGSKMGLNMNGGEVVLETEENSITGAVLNSANGLLIGGGAGNLNGQLDDLRFYDSALDAAAIQALYDPEGIHAPIAQWPFENNLRDTVGEAHGHIQPEEYAASFSDSDVKEGDYSIEFDGNYYLNCLDPDTLKNLDEFTVAFWMKVNGATADKMQSIIEKDSKFRVIILDGGYLDMVVATEDIGWYQTGGSLQKFPVPPSDEWVHLALYYDGSKLGLNMNGGETILETEENSITGAVLNSASGFLIGGNPDLGKFNGKLDDIRFYSKALSQAGIEELYNSYPSDTEPPTTPGNLTKSNVGETSVELSWEASTDNVGVAAYYLLQNNTRIDTVSGETAVTVTGLKPETEYDFSVLASDISGNLSDTSNVVTVTTLESSDAEPPSAPTNLTVLDEQLVSVYIQWDAATDNVGVVEYIILQDGVEIDTVTSLGADIFGIEPGTEFEFTVKAVDAAGNVSEASDPVSATTLQAPSGSELVAHWTFEENNENVVPEATEFDGNILGGDTLYYSSDAKQGATSLEFDGVSFLNCGEPAAAESMEAFSVSLWMNMSETPEAVDVILAEGSEYTLYTETRGADSAIVGFGIATDYVAWWGGAGSFLYDTTILHSNEWYHIAFVYSGVKTKIYINGELSMENPEYITGNTSENGNYLVMGGTGNDDNFKGLMDDVRFYTGVLEDEEIMALYTNTASKKIKIEDAFKIYPNPVKDVLHFQNLDGKSRIRIFSIAGKMAYETVTNRNHFTLNVNNFRNGIYLVAVENEQGRNIKKLVISKE